MELVEKLEIFYASAIEVASKESEDALNKYKDSLKDISAEFKRNKEQEMEALYQLEEAKIKREINRELSDAITKQKQGLNIKQQEKKQMLFCRVKQMLADYRETEAYEAYLVSKIRMAKKFAKNSFASEEDLILYLDPADADKKDKLEQEAGCRLTISEVCFSGGIRAVIRSKNILIDESFVTKLDQEWEAYTF